MTQSNIYQTNSLNYTMFKYAQMNGDKMTTTDKFLASGDACNSPV